MIFEVWILYFGFCERAFIPVFVISLLTFFFFEELISMLTKEPTSSNYLLSAQLFVICDKGKGIPCIEYIFILRNSPAVKEGRHIPDTGYIFP